MPSPDSRGHGIPLFGHLERKKMAERKDIKKGQPQLLVVVFICRC